MVMKIVVTGGGGFLGAAMVRRLLHDGHKVSVVARGLTSAAQPDVEFIKTDINNLTNLKVAFRNADVVVHCAALSAPWGRRADFMLNNVQGTAHVVAAADAMKVRRLVHVSSASVYFEYADRLGMREDAPLPAPVNAYAESKQLAEREAVKFNGEVFIMRPRGIYGPGDPHLLPRLLRVMKSKPLPLLRGGAASVSGHQAGYYVKPALLGGDCTFVLGASGHIAGVVNPPARKKRSFWRGPLRRGQQQLDARAWFEHAGETPGSWWNVWADWLAAQRGREIGARRTLGSATFKPLADAPGDYVKVRI